MQHLFQASFSCGGVDKLSPADAPTSLLVGVHFRAHGASVLLCVWHSFGWKDGIIISSWLTFVYGISSFIDLYKVRSLNFCSNAGFVLVILFFCSDKYLLAIKHVPRIFIWVPIHQLPYHIRVYYVIVPTPPGRSWKISLISESPGNLCAGSWNLLVNDADADAKICASTRIMCSKHYVFE